MQLRQELTTHSPSLFTGAYPSPISRQTDSLRMLPLEELSEFWQRFFARADDAIKENFWGNLSILKKAARNGDAYAKQLEEIGYSFKEGREKVAPFYQTINWALGKLNYIVKSGQLKESEILIPAKAFEIDQNGEKNYVFVPFGGEVPKGGKELNLLSPDVFVNMLSQGYFPIGEPIREHTNQTLCEHDMAHIAGFISCPRYMKAVRQAFQQISELMKTTPAIKEALANFDSIYSLRLYYMIEIFSIIPETNRDLMEGVLELKIKDFSLDQPENIYPNVLAFLRSKTPAELSEYLYRVYESFPAIVNPLGGESRDILNRTRKFGRSNQTGSFYSAMSNLDSKFDGSSIYSLLMNAKAAHEYKRSTHRDYQETIESIHAPIIATMLGTSQLSVEDWVLEAVKETPDKGSKLYKYICETALWNKSHVLYWAYGHPDCTKVLKKDDFTGGSMFFEDAVVTPSVKM